MPTGDVFVHNMRQEAMDKLGFTFKAVREVNPRSSMPPRSASAGTAATPASPPTTT